MVRRCRVPVGLGIVAFVLLVSHFFSPSSCIIINELLHVIQIHVSLAQTIEAGNSAGYTDYPLPRNGMRDALVIEQHPVIIRNGKKKTRTLT